MTLKYQESFIKKIKESYDYKINLENPYIFERSTELIDDNFNQCLKIIEIYEKKISAEIKKFNPKLNKPKGYTKYYHQDKNKGKNKSFDFMRIPKERPVTFLNEKKGKDDELKKELNGNLNKLSNGNANKIFKNILELYEKNLEIFDYHHFIEILFDKAVMQPIYCPLYVKLFMELRKKYLTLINKPDLNTEDAEGEETLKEDELSSLIRDKCNLFMKMITEFTEDDVLNPNNYDDFCQKNKKKVYKKGFSQFIGELYKNRFVDSEYLGNYMDALSQNILSCLNDNNTNVENASICLVQLVNTTVNRRLFKNNKCFDKIRVIMNHPTLPKKIKFKFMDLLGV
jgi:hypothetical protein